MQGRGRSGGFLVLLLCTAWVTTRAATFYVDAVKGNDAASGTSPNEAWASLDKVNGHKFEPGDQILFRAGETFPGRLSPHGSGTAEAPVVMAAYGPGAKPVIAGGGADQALMLDELSYWTVRGLAVTNHGKTVGVRNGIEIHVSVAGLSRSIHLEGVDVSDVNGDVHSKSSGGIGILGWEKNGKAPRFDDVSIDHCSVRHVDGQGIWVHMKGKDAASPDSDDGVSGEYPITRMRISHTLIEDTGRNAIFLRDAEGALLDHNRVLHASARTHGNAVVVAWSKDTVVRDNEVAYTGVDQGSGENGGFDADDGAVGTVFEHNWTHDNTGGSINVVVDPGKHVPNDNTTIRFNLSENDGVRVFGVGGTVTRVVIANNTIYVGKGRSESVLDLGRFTAHKPGDPDQIFFVNNIVYAQGDASYKLEASHVAVDSNCFFGKHAGGPKDEHKVTADPGFASANLPAKSWEGLAAYRPAKGSACSAAGRSLGVSGEYDLLGSPVSPGASFRGAVASE